MGQLFSSEEELHQIKDAVGCVLYEAMMEAGCLPDLRVVHPLILSNHHEESDCLQKQLKQLQSDIGNKAPSYLKDLIGRLSTFTDEPRLASLVGLVVTMVMDLAYTSSKQSSGVKGRTAGSSTCQQRMWELQEVMEEYLKRWRISLSDKNRLIQDAVRLEAQISLILTQLKTSMLGGDCDSGSLRHWASGAAFHTQMLVHLSCLESKAEPLSARAALEQYKEDLTQILPAYRRFKSNTVCVVKCRAAKSDFSAELPEEGAMTGLTVTDKETGKSVTIPLSHLEAETGKRKQVSVPDVNLDLIASDQFAQLYLERLFSDDGPVAELQSFFTKAAEKLRTQRNDRGYEKKAAAPTEGERGEEVDGRLKLSIAERGLNHGHPG